MLRKMAAKYEGWSREALIARLLELESPLKHALSPPQTTEAGKRKKKEMDFSKYCSRKVAIKFAYLGWSYHGLAWQKDLHTPTVEGQIMKALHKTRCVQSLDPQLCDFSRCGRTDAEVSAMAQVISLRLRSCLNESELQDPANDSKELDYLKILNSQLPPDVVAYELCLRPPPDFDARFSCVSRHYRYYFRGEGLDLAQMQNAANKLAGVHDFRNFCRVDASKQITNFTREILHAEIVQENSQKNLYYLSLRGTAFLWNQVRSIMAVLFLVGQGYERACVVEKLLDVEKHPRRPAYEIAWGVPLVLYNCEFKDIVWDRKMPDIDDLYNLRYDHDTKVNMASIMLSVVAPGLEPPGANRVNTGRGIGRRSKYVPLFDRALLETPEVVNQRWLEKQSRKEDH